jgi:probable HAF family extracellular repeat protein
MQTHQRVSLFLMSLTLATANAAWAYPEYRVTVVGPANSAATDINSSGVVVGTRPYGPTSTRGFLNRGKGLVDLGTLGGRSSEAVAINDKGEVLGNWTTRGGEQRGFIYDSGKQRDIGAIRGRTTTFTDINNAGYATAIGASPNFPDGVRSYLREPNGKLRDIGNLPFGEPTLTNALALNNRNQITGESGELIFPDQPLRAFTWTKGVMRDLGDFGWTPNGGLAINDRGQITGHMSVPTGFRSRVAFIYSNGRLINIDGRPASVEQRSSGGDGINNHGHVVGSSDHLSGFVYRGKRMQSLNALIDPKAGWDIAMPRAINDAGQIAATAYRQGVAYAVRLDLIRPHLLAAPELEKDQD